MRLRRVNYPSGATSTGRRLALLHGAPDQDTSGDRPTYEEVRIESSVLAHVANGPIDGISLSALKLALPYGAQGVVDAVHTLERLGAIHTEDQRLVLGPGPGSRQSDHHPPTGGMGR